MFILPPTYLPLLFVPTIPVHMVPHTDDDTAASTVSFTTDVFITAELRMFPASVISTIPSIPSVRLFSRIWGSLEFVMVVIRI